MGLLLSFAEQEGMFGCSGVVVTHVQVVLEISGCHVLELSGCSGEDLLSAIDLVLYKEGTNERVRSLGTVAELTTPKQLDPILRVVWGEEDAQDYELRAVTNRDLHVTAATGVHVLFEVKCTGYGFYKICAGPQNETSGDTLTVSRAKESS